jgi:SAM-dependent methyltransferase
MSWISRWLPLLRFGGSRDYWEKRYRLGGDSGAGSYGEPARYKAAVLNQFVADHDVRSLIEFGCGDGHQLALARYPAYLGIDISQAAVDMCKARFTGDPTKQFTTTADYRGEQADLALSLDVLFHLVEDDVFDGYLESLFAAAQRFVIVYSTSTADPVKTLPHVRHRDVEQAIASRYPAFTRMRADESAVPPPVQEGQGLSTRFFFYQRT